MAKTIIQIYNELVSLGHDVKIYKRKDGGYLIKSIGTRKFSGASGNAFARELLRIPKEQRLSQRKLSQLKSITTLRSQSQEFKSLYKKTRDVWNKAIKEGNLKVKGKIKPQRVIDFLNRYGEEQAKQALLKKQKYAEGIAYPENVQYFITTLERFIIDAKAKNVSVETIAGLTDIINYLKLNIDTIKEWTLKEIIDLSYEVKKKLTEETIKTFVSNVNSVLKRVEQEN